MGIHQGEALNLLGLRKTPVLRPALQSNQSSLCGLHCSRDQGGGELDNKIISIKKATDGRRQTSREIIEEKREKYRAKNRLKRNDFCDLEKPCKHAYQKGKIEFIEQSKKRGQPNQICGKEWGARQS